jgi:hypothetical protein
VQSLSGLAARSRRLDGPGKPRPRADDRHATAGQISRGPAVKPRSVGYLFSV